MSPDEFVTIAEAARRLGISERQAWRYVRHVSDTDRKASDTRQTLVSLNALSEAAKRPISGSNGLTGTPDSVRHVEEKASDIDNHVSDTMPDAREALIAELRAVIERQEGQHRAEVERLNNALERAQGALSQALTALTAEQQRTALLEAQQTRLIEALPPALLQERPEKTSDAPESDTATEGEGSQPAQEGGNGAARGRQQENSTKTASEQQQENEPRAAPTRPWWRFWQRQERA